MINKIEKIARGYLCPKCESTTLYKLSDKRVKCRQCGFKFSTVKVLDDFKILHYFSLEIPANKAAKDIQCNYRKVSNKYKQYREEIIEFLSKEYKKLSGEIECDESYFGGKRKYKRGRGAYNKTKVFGMLERHGKIYTTIINDVTAKTLMNEIIKNSEKGSVFYTDKFKSYKSLKFYGKHISIDHSKNFAKSKNHINGLEGFWSFAKERLLKYHGISKNNFHFYLKEMEFRYNYRKENIYHLLTKIHFGPFFT
jgi:transposase